MPKPQPRPGISDSFNRGAPRVLLVDDDDDIRDSAALFLASEGFDVVAVADGPTALDCVRRGCPSIVVVDLCIPGMSGRELCDWLRQHRRTLPVLAFTSSGLRTGAVGDVPVISKSHPDALVAALRVLVG